MDSKILITMVTQCPPLWDRHHEKFRDKEFKAALWDQLGFQLNTSGTACRESFKSLREKYIREREKIQQHGTDHMTWDLFQLMQFLEPHIITRKQGCHLYQDDWTSAHSSTSNLEDFIETNIDIKCNNLNDTEFCKTLIKLVYEMKPLWDRQTSTSKVDKTHLWKIIAATLNSEANTCALRWKGLREKYIRQKQRFLEGETKWELLNDLAFLDSVIQYRKKDSELLLETLSACESQLEDNPENFVSNNYSINNCYPKNFPSSSIQVTTNINQNQTNTTDVVNNSINLTETEFCQELIQKVYQMKPLWNRKILTTKSNKDHLWKIIANDLHSKPDVCALRWKGLREKYIRQKQRYSEGEAKWELLDSLSFLDNVIHYRKKNSPFDESNVLPTNKSQDNDHPDLDDYDRNVLPVIKPHDNDLLDDRTDNSNSNVLSVIESQDNDRIDHNDSNVLSAIKSQDNVFLDDRTDDSDPSISNSFVGNSYSSNVNIECRLNVTDSNNSSLIEADFYKRLIKLVHENKPLWERRIATSKVNKDQLWKAVGEALNSKPHVCALRWKALREKYIRQKQKYTEGEAKWELLDSLSFLDQVICYRKKSFLLDESSESQIESNIDNDLSDDQTNDSYSNIPSSSTRYHKQNIANTTRIEENISKSNDMNSCNNVTEIEFSKTLTKMVYEMKPLWDRQHSTSKAGKDHLWKIIATTLNSKPQICSSRWKGLREKYIRQKQKYLEGEAKWELLDSLSFLDSVIQYRKKNSIEDFGTLSSSDNLDSQFLDDATNDSTPNFPSSSTNCTQLIASNPLFTNDIKPYMPDSTLDFTLTRKRTLSDASEVSENVKRDKLVRTEKNKTPEEIFGQFVSAMLALKEDREKSVAMMEIMSILTKPQ